MSKGMKKRIALLLAAIMAAGSFTGCGGTGSQDNSGTTGDNEETSSSEGEKTGEGITIRLLTRMSGADSGTQLKEEVLAEFQEKYPGITIQDESTNDSNSFDTQFRTDIASGNVADIIQWPGISIMKEYADTIQIELQNHG